MSIKFPVCALLLALVYSALPVRATPYPLVVSNQTVRVCIFKLDGYHYFHDGKPISGYGFDYLQFLRSYAPWRYEYVGMDKHWSDMLPMLQAGEIDLATCVLKTPEREAKFAFSRRPMGYISATMIATRIGASKFAPEDYAHWNGIRVGLMRNGPLNELFSLFASLKKFTYTPVFFDSRTELFDAFDTDIIDAIISSDNIRPINKAQTYENFHARPFFLAVRKTDTELLKTLNTAMDMLYTQSPDIETAIPARYASERTSDTVIYTAEERAFINAMNASGTILTAVMNPDRKPISYYENGAYHGSMKDVADEIIRRTGLRVIFFPSHSRKDYYVNDNKDPSIDIVFDFHYNLASAEARHLKLTTPYFHTTTTILHRKNKPNEFQSLAYVTYSNEPKTYNSLFAPNATTIFYNSFEEAIEHVANGAVDAMYLHADCASYAVQNDWRGRLAVKVIPSRADWYAIGVRDTCNPLLFSIINKATRSIDQDFITRAILANSAKNTTTNSLTRTIFENPIPFVFAIFASIGFLSFLLFFAFSNQRRFRIDRRFLQLTLSTVTDGLISTTLDGHIIRINPAAARMINVDHNTVAGKPLADVFAPRNLRSGDPTVLSLDEPALLDDLFDGVHGTGLLPQPDGHEALRVNYTVKPILNNVNKPLGMLIIFRDVTEAYQRDMEIKNELVQWNAISSISQIYHFTFNPHTSKVSGNIPPDIWPQENDTAAPPESWIHPDDLFTWKYGYTQLLTGEKSEVCLRHRISSNGRIRHFSVFMRRVDEHCVSGIIQDITALIEEREQHEKDMQAEQHRREAIQHQWEILANAIPAILFIKDADDGYRYLYANNKLGEFYNVPIDAIIAHHEYDFISQDDARSIRANDVATMTAGKTETRYELIHDANGIAHHFHSIKIPSVNELGHRILIQMTTDVTELESLSEIRKIIADALESLFCTNDLEDAVRDFIQNICSFIGFTRGFLFRIDTETNVGSLFTMYTPANETPLFENESHEGESFTDDPCYPFLQKLWKNKFRTFNLDNPTDATAASNTLPWVMAYRDKLNIRTIHVQHIETDGKPWGDLLFITEHAAYKKISSNEQALLAMAANIIELAITRKRTYGILEKEVEAARIAADVKSNFLATMSHEIRTPLNAVIGFSDLLQDAKLDPATRREYLKNISDAGKILLSLINDILDLSKLSAGKMEITPVESSLQEIVAQIGIFFRPKCIAKQIHFIAAIPTTIPTLWLDPSRMRQLFFNLVGNAIKFTNVGSVTVDAEFTPDTPETGHLCIHVCDTGIGISENDQQSIFQPFTQVNTTPGTKTRDDGTGLGLPICKKILDSMNGDIYVESAPDKGTTFTLELRNVRYVSHTVATPRPPVIAPEPAPELPDFSHLSVLIVDDVPLNLKVLQATLKKLGIQADMANSADDALNQFDKKAFNYVITDLWMPERNGVELAQAIRSRKTEHAVRIAVITADLSGREHFDYSVFDTCLTKPLATRALIDFFTASQA